MHTAIGIGEVLWDVFEDGRVLGGAPANFAYHVHCLNCTGLTFSRIGSDKPGEDILATLRGAGLCTEFIQRDNDHPTGKVDIELDEEGVPRFDILEDVAWDYMQAERRWLDAARGADAICFGTLSQRNACSRETIYKVLDAAEKTTCVLDLNLRDDLFSHDIITESMKRCDILKINTYELATLREMFECEHEDNTSFSHHIIEDYEIDLLCITRGEDGCELYTSDSTAEAAAPSTSIVDTVGAGDAFCAGLTVNYLEGKDLQSIARGANLMGAYVAGCRGAMPDVPENIVEDFLGT
ncbi:MAG: carbohydrate kinase family protein [Planctomycetota bacterium]